jgi:hypothetical protein
MTGVMIMNANSYLKPAWTHNGSIRTDLPLKVFPGWRRKQAAAAVEVGQLCCTGKVFLKTRNGLVRIM